MSDKRKKKKFAEKREQRRLNKAAQEGRLVDGVEMPRGAVPADQSQQVPNNSYSAPPAYYVDIEFTCQDCGRDEVWTGKQQKWYYEVAKGPLFATAIRCRAAPIVTSLTRQSARSSDVVILDWSQDDSSAQHSASPLGSLAEWSTPTVFVGSAGYLQSNRWGVIGSVG